MWQGTTICAVCATRPTSTRCLEHPAETPNTFHPSHCVTNHLHPQLLCWPRTPSWPSLAAPFKVSTWNKPYMVSSALDHNFKQSAWSKQSGLCPCVSRATNDQGLFGFKATGVAKGVHHVPLHAPPCECRTYTLKRNAFFSQTSLCQFICLNILQNLWIPVKGQNMIYKLINKNYSNYTLYDIKNNIARIPKTSCWTAGIVFTALPKGPAVKHPEGRAARVLVLGRNPLVCLFYAVVVVVCGLNGCNRRCSRIAETNSTGK